MHTWYQLFEHSADAVFGIDKQRRIRFWNHSCGQILARSRGKALERSCAELLCGTSLTGQAVCGPHCPITTSRSETVPDFDMLVSSNDSIPTLLNVSAHFVPGALQQKPDDVVVFFNLRRIDCHRLIQRMATNHCVQKTPALQKPLSARELDVLRLAAEGLGSREIGQNLNISESTVRNHCKRIFTKLGVHSRAEAVYLASSLHLL